MRYFCALILSLSSVIVWAETKPSESPASSAPSANPQATLLLLQSKQIDLAKAEIERVTELVNAGALPRIRLDEANEKLADAQDDAILARTLYGELPTGALSQEMADEMVAAAQRRMERQIAKLAKMQKLVNDGIIAQGELQPLKDELNMRSMNLNLAHSRAKLIGELAAIAKYEQSMQALKTVIPYTDFTLKSMEHFQGNGLLLGTKDLKILEAVFVKRFDRALPISADGQTATHDSLGFDHRGRVDVALNPNEPAGIWLRHYLEAKGIPYFAFLRAVPGKATGAHIHIGPGSTRLHNAD